MSGATLKSSPLAVQRGILGAVLLVLCWEGLARGLHLPSYVLPAVSEILTGIWSKRALLGEAAGYTLLEALLGYGSGCLIGIGLAVVITMLPALRGVILPAATAINSVPVVGYSPLILLWFGIGVASKMVMVAMAVSFTVFLSTLAGLDRVDRRAVDLMRSFGAGRAACRDARFHRPQRHRCDHHRDARRLWRARLGDLPGRAADRFRAGLVGDFRRIGGEPDLLRPDRLARTQNPVLEMIR